MAAEKEAQKMIGMVEKMGCACLNLGCLFLVLGILSVIALIVSGISNPMEAIKALFSNLWCAAIGGCK